MFIHGIQERKDNLVGRKSLRLDIDHHSVCSTFSCLFLMNHSAWALKNFFLKIPDVNIVELNIKRKWEKMSWHIKTQRFTQKWERTEEIPKSSGYSIQLFFFYVHVTKKLLTQLVTWLLHVFETIKINKIF